MKKNFAKKAVALMLSVIVPAFMAVADQAEALQKKLARLTSFQASFDQTVVDASNKLIQQGEGMLSLKQPSLFRFETQTPEPNLFVGDGKTLWFYAEVLDQVSIFDAKEQVQKTPFVLLTSHDPKLWAQYNVTGADELFDITPKDPGNAVKKLSLKFSGLALSQMVVMDSNGQNSTFDFNLVQYNTPLASELFQFAIPASAEVDDQRVK
ncbi:outer membrane lipoprotein carrier protein LolA [Rheinheimera sediminis]|uniref:outer membrane lipoprotein chaperone LolA n=1 Tax=Rheinheimera sp. YQF-1 TaxID=2499626 RepID=UPI000FDCDA1F|nr:outer membrane lipoprotein chaperone LolA [Rheinheimera sp. YQF-1]RVT47335.1 outer membrane lipoprotein carrier protein LolA [Rheinheimera sp. YQF-1]